MRRLFLVALASFGLAVLFLGATLFGPLARDLVIVSFYAVAGWILARAAARWSEHENERIRRSRNRRTLGEAALSLGVLGLCFAGSAAGVATNFQNLNGIRFVDLFPGADFGTRLSAAYADLPATGGYIALGQDQTLTTPAKITMVDGKPLILDLMGRTLSFAHASGTGLIVAAGSGNSRNMRVTVKNGIVRCSSCGAGTTGISVSSLQYVIFRELQVLDFSGKETTAVSWQFVEDSVIENTEFRDNNIALKLFQATNNDLFSAVWFQSNGWPLLVLNGSSGNTFQTCLFQSNAHPLSLVSHGVQDSPGQGAIVGNHFSDCWFENNGDASGSSTQVLMASDHSGSVAGTVFDNNLFYPNKNGAKGTVFIFNNYGGAGFIGNNVYRNNTIALSGFAAGRCGASCSMDVGSTIENENIQSASNPSTFTKSSP